MEYQPKIVGFLLAALIITGFGATQSSDWQQIKQDEELNLEQSPSSDSPQVSPSNVRYVNGTINLEVNITPKQNSSSYSAELVELSMDEDSSMKPGTIRATGSQGESHTAELLTSEGEVIESYTFRLYSESVENRRYVENGSYAPPRYIKEYYPKHVFNFENNYSAREIRIDGKGIKPVKIDIAKQVCSGTNYPYYCEYKNFTKTDGEEKRGIFNGGSAEINFWEKIIDIILSWLPV